MDFLHCNNSDVAAFFAGKTVLITGGTGFIGKLVIEKLLRACPRIRKILLIVREKRGVSVHQRLQKLLAEEVFAGVLQRRPEVRSLVEAVVGDTEKPSLGLSDEDIRRIESEVNIVVHSAATVKFNEPLARAVRANVEATGELIALAHRIKNLCSFVHVSTAYVNVTVHEEIVEERVYPWDLKAEDLLKLVKCLPAEALEAATPHLLGGYPNTYTYTKRFAEELVLDSGLPASIVRPSIVIATAKEPFPGWIDNVNGPTGFILAMGTGCLTALHLDVDKKFDLVPADIVVNCIIVAAFKRATLDAGSEKSPVPILHACLGRSGSISSQQFYDMSLSLLEEYPLKYCLRLPIPKICNTMWEYRLRLFLFHRLPMEMADFALCRLGGNKMPVRKLYARLISGLEVMSFFFKHDWDFKLTNSTQMHQSLSEVDQYLFPVTTPDDFQWSDFIKVYLFSIKYFLVKEDLTTIEAGRAWRKKLVAISYGSTALTGFLVAKAAASIFEMTTGLDVPML